ncbi:MAG: glycosyltransferase family 39 protein [Proteobacteria bacterium]|nr:glycosyltransferase family 39 protein [Pseudomonadota bacterium]
MAILNSGGGAADASARSFPAGLAPVLRFMLAGLAVALVTYGLEGFGNPGLLRPRDYWWVAVLGCALVPAAATLGTSWAGAGLVAATLMAGFGAQLAIRDPFWFQRVSYRPVSDFSYIEFWAIALQAVTALAVWTRCGAVRRIGPVVAGLGLWRVLLLALLLVVAARSVMDAVADHDARKYVVQEAIALAFLGVNLAAFAALLMALPRAGTEALSARVAAAISLPGATDGPRPHDRALLLGLALSVLAVCALVALLSMQAIPLLDDSTYRFQARYLSHGAIALPVPPDPHAFSFYMLTSYGAKWFATTFPGWPLALALTEPIGPQWLVNPLLAALSIFLLHRFVREVTDRGTANLAAFLLAVSPWYLSMSATQLLHTFTYALILGAWVLLMRARERPSALFGLLAGLLMGWLFLTRPLEGVMIGGLTGLWTLTFLRDRRQWWTVGFYALGCILVGAAIFPYDTYLTGAPLRTPINAYLDRLWGPGANDFGFGPNRGPATRWGVIDVFPGHSPLEALINTHQNFQELQFSFLGWGGASLLFAMIQMIWGKWTRLTAAMALICGLTAGVYALYWFVGAFFAGPRYWFLMIVPLVIFTALGIVTSVRLLSRLFPDGLVAGRLAVGIAFMGVISIVVFESWMAFNRFPEFGGYHADYYKMSRQAEYRDSVIFIRADEGDNGTEYGSAFWLNDFSKDAHSPIFARDLGPGSERAVAAAWPGRRIFFVEGRTKDRPHATVVQGPLTLDQIGQGTAPLSAAPGG